jgi:hypothetical protein
VIDAVPCKAASREACVVAVGLDLALRRQTGADHMDDIVTRIWQNLGDRITGPMSLRLVLQPTMAIIFGIRAGMRDARLGRSPYVVRVLTSDRSERRRLLLQGWKAIAMVFCLACALDGIYQFVVQRWIYPGELLLVAFLLACVPYILVRGAVDRVLRAMTPARTDNV